VLIKPYNINGILSDTIVDLSKATFTVNDKTLTIESPTPYLANATKYQISVQQVKDTLINEMIGLCMWEFATSGYPDVVYPTPIGECGIDTTSDTTAPQVASFAPTRTAVQINSNINITFDRSINTKTLISNITIQDTSNNLTLPVSQFDFNYNCTNFKLTLNPKSTPLNSVTEYEVSVLSGIEDMYGNSLAANFNK